MSLIPTLILDVEKAVTSHCEAYAVEKDVASIMLKIVALNVVAGRAERSSTCRGTVNGSGGVHPTAAGSASLLAQTLARAVNVLVVVIGW